MSHHYTTQCCDDVEGIEKGVKELHSAGRPYDLKEVLSTAACTLKLKHWHELVRENSVVDISPNQLGDDTWQVNAVYVMEFMQKMGATLDIMKDTSLRILRYPGNITRHWLEARNDWMARNQSDPEQPEGHGGWRAGVVHFKLLMASIPTAIPDVYDAVL